MDDRLTWESSYAIAVSLKNSHPQINDLIEISLENIYDWTLALPFFDDDPELANEEILLAIFTDWMEELMQGE